MASQADGVVIAVLSDIHGNRWALEEVLKDASGRGAATVFDLGDSLYGPLDPRGTAELLMEVAPPTLAVVGNEDRALWERDTPLAEHGSLEFARSVLEPHHLAWLRARPRRARHGSILLCHGTPHSDTQPLLEEVTPSGVCLRSGEEIDERLAFEGEPDPEVVVCGHTHVPRVARTTRGILVVNPGSVGLPAYADDRPVPHRMEAGSPHARYAVLTRGEHGWSVEQRCVGYDDEAAARAAERNGRPDWARALRTGRA